MKRSGSDWGRKTSDVIRRRQENWKCKLDDINSNRNTKKVYVGVMEGRKPRGRQRMR